AVGPLTSVAEFAVGQDWNPDPRRIPLRIQWRETDRETDACRTGPSTSRGGPHDGAAVVRVGRPFYGARLHHAAQLRSQHQDGSRADLQEPYALPRPGI